MQKILKSFVTLGALGVMLVSATGAYFTSTVTAEDNVITTGSLLLAVDAADESTYVASTWAYPTAYNVVTENLDGSFTVGMPFIPWTNAAPADTHTYTVGVRNNGTIPLNYKAAAVGAWVSGPRFGTLSCPADAASADASLVSVTNVHLYKTTAAGGCEGDIGCRNLRDGLQTGPWTPFTSGSLIAGDVVNPTGWYYGTLDGTDGAQDLTSASYIQLGQGEFVVYQIEAELDPSADSCYQGATYNFDLTVAGKQVNDPNPTW